MTVWRSILAFCQVHKDGWWTERPWKYLWNICGRYDCGFCQGLRTIYVTALSLYGIVIVCAIIEKVLVWIL